MPHLTVEYAAGEDRQPDIPRLCTSLHDAMIATGVLPRAGIRIRAYRVEHAIIADDHPLNGFVAMTLSVGTGRTTEQLQGAGNRLFQAAQIALAGLLQDPYFALSLEIRVINPALSWKDTPIHARLTGPPQQGPVNEPT